MGGAPWDNSFDHSALADLRSKLELIAEELADLGQAVLQRALHDGPDEDASSAPGLAAEERRLATARRAVLRAVAALSAATGED